MAEQEGILGDIETLFKADKAPFLVVLEAVVVKAIPAVLEALAGQETAVEIAAPYVRDLWSFGSQALSDMASGKGAVAVLQDLDSAVADAIEKIRFGTGTP